MNKEVLFAKTLEDVRALAKEQGNCVSEEQVQEAFAALDLNNDQLQMVFDYLVKHKVGIGQPVNIEDYLTDEERNSLQDYLETCCIQSTFIYMAGEVTAQNRLVEMYLENVVDIAKLYSGQGVLLEDLIGEGNVALAFGTGMLGSLEKPEEADGFLGKLIMDAMEDYIQENSANEKADLKVVDKVNKVMERAKELSEDLHRKVTVQELADETGMSVKSIQDAIRMSGFQIDYIE